MESPASNVASSSPSRLSVNDAVGTSEKPSDRTSLPSPLRQHRRTSSRNAGMRVKETLNARSHYGSSEDDGASIVRVNQYVLREEIGRGSFGAVHLAVDQFGTEYAVKEFSKARLRKRAQSNLLRKPNQKRPSGYLAPSFDSSHNRQGLAKPNGGLTNNSLDLIKEEIAIMKKLDHNNLVSLIEVLDDPDEDSLYMVLEMCKRGVVMKVGLDDTAEPCDDERCRCWFRDMVLGIEYLHAQGIIHRDIKPDNCLVTQDNVLKIVDFGVSEMFEKHSTMSTAKFAGSPAFMPPELCVANHGLVSGRAADIWSMGVTLYCLRYGKIPFSRDNLPELYDSIRDEELAIDSGEQADFRDLIFRLLEKDPSKRITMNQIREHPWVTRNGEDPLLPENENCSDIVEPPTEHDIAHAITNNMSHLLAVMSAVRRFKQLLTRKRSSPIENILEQLDLTSSPTEIKPTNPAVQKNVLDKASSALSRKPNTQAQMNTGSMILPEDAVQHSPGTNDDTAKPVLFLSIGPGDDALTHHEKPRRTPVVAESPDSSERNLYEEAYKLELERIRSEKGSADVVVHSNRRMEKPSSHWNSVRDNLAGG